MEQRGRDDKYQKRGGDDKYRNRDEETIYTGTELKRR